MQLKNISTIIGILRPTAKPDIDYTLQDNSDGKGPFIKMWKHASPEPTKAELGAKETEAKNTITKLSLLEKILELQNTIVLQDSLTSMTLNTTPDKTERDNLIQQYKLIP